MECVHRNPNGVGFINIGQYSKANQKASHRTLYNTKAQDLGYST